MWIDLIGQDILIDYNVCYMIWYYITQFNNKKSGFTSYMVLLFYIAGNVLIWFSFFEVAFQQLWQDINFPCYGKLYKTLHQVPSDYAK